MTVIVVTYQSASVLPATVASIRRQIPGSEVIVVDNGSTDATVALAREVGVDLVMHGHGNVGFGAGNNLGVESASNEQILLLNPDCQVVAAEAHALGCLSSEQYLGLRGCSELIGTKVRPNEEQVWPWRRELWWVVFKQFIETRWMDLPRPSRLSRSSVWVSGFALLARRSEFLEVGGFDPGFFLYWEDYELSLRYARAGLPVKGTSAIQVAHDWRGSSESVDSGAAFSLWGYIEWVDRAYGSREAAQAARLAVKVLRSVELYAGRGNSLPTVGRLFAKKADLAQAMLRRIETGPSEEGIARVRYPAAQLAFARALA
jgi:N-acetylglucosaminyl-diphospho-decaprenol L-rhamnosyltransferase